MKARIRAVGAICCAAAFAIDHASKALALEFRAALGGGIEIFPGFDLVLVRNTGVTFGLLSGVPWWVLVGLSLAILTGLFVWLWGAQDYLTSSSIGLVAGGGIGNAFDRFRFGHVTDFLDLHIGGYHWPAFNLADVVVVIGLFLLILPALRSRKQQTRRMV